MTDAGKYVQGVAESMINGLQSLDVDITRLLDTWRGERATDFDAGWTEAKQGAGDVLAALAAIGESLGLAGLGLSDVDEQFAERISSLDLP